MDNEAREENSSFQNAKSIQSTQFKNSSAGSYQEIHLSDGTVFFILQEIWQGNSLKEGQEISLEDELRLYKADNLFHCLEKALKILSFNPQSTYLLKLKLLKKGFSDELAEKTCEFLKSKDLLNDERFARNWADVRMQKKPLGPYGLAAALAKKGIDRRVSDKIISSFQNNDYKKALNTLVKKLKKQGKDQEKIKKYLIRQGFCYTDIKGSIQNNENNLE